MMAFLTFGSTNLFYLLLKIFEHLFIVTQALGQNLLNLHYLLERALYKITITLLHLPLQKEFQLCVCFERKNIGLLFAKYLNIRLNPLQVFKSKLYIGQLRS